MATKICFKCNIKKPLSQFYKHKEMKDGHVNKCKECNLKDVKGNYIDNVKKPGYIEKERKRGRQKHHRLYSGITKTKNKNRQKWIDKYPEKEAVRTLCSRSTPKGFHSHHWSYNKEHGKDVIVLLIKYHYKAHRFIIYDQERMMYRRYDTNELLDTKEKHLAFITDCINNQED
jgi:hypothetical protein